MPILPGMKNTLTQDQQELVSDVLQQMTESRLIQRTSYRITERDARCWLSYYADTAAAADKAIVRAVVDGFNGRKG